MATEWNFEHDIHGRFVTCQRPIVFTTYCSDITVLHFKAQMYIKDNTNDWIETDVVCKGYHDSDFNYYSFNVSEYVRNYFAVSSNWLRQNICVDPENQIYGGKLREMFHREFRFNVWPVVGYEDLSTEELTGLSQYTRAFNVVELNTKNNEITCLDPDNKTRIDNFVSGTCDGASYDNTFGEIDYLGAEYHRAMTNMPGLTPHSGTEAVGPFNVINTNDGYFNSFLISPWIYFTGKYQRIQYKFRNAATGVWEDTYNIDTVDGCPLLEGNLEGDDNQLIYYNIHPFFIDVILTDTYGAADYIFSNSDNSLLVDRMTIQITTRTVSPDEEHRGAAKYTFDITDKDNDGKCRRTKFVFKNMRGGIDWFSCYGTEEKKIDLSSQRYEQNQKFSRGGGSRFGVSPGEHSTTNVWTQRTESFSVTTQPLTTEWVEWLEELVVSPQVWVEVEQENINNDISYPKNKTLIPIVIDTGSYKVYSTEDNVHYVEFKYALSDNTLTQIGY